MIIPAFILNSQTDWRRSLPEDWELETILVSGSEKVLGHKKIDGAICRILQNEEGQIVAIVK